MALVVEDPWEGFASYVRTAAELQARDRGIADLVTMELPTAPEIEQLRARAFDGLVRLVERAVGIASQASARLVQVLLDGLCADAATDGAVAPGAPQVEAAMRANGERRLGTGP